MSLLNDSYLRHVYGITDEERQRMIDYIRGSVYNWCKNQTNEWFAVRDLFGGINFYWEETPLMPLYEKHAKTKSNIDAIKAAGIDAGWLLKKILIEDKKREFESRKHRMVKEYKWTGREF